jgi:Fe2+ or Zn2+ uptake regulation protein
MIPKKEPLRRGDPPPEPAGRLRGLGLRATGPRLAILSALEADLGHPTPERILDRLRGAYPSLSLSTVYETIETFARAGLCRRVARTSGKLRVDGTPGDHDHAVCRGCGEVLDVPAASDAIGRPPLPRGTRLLGMHVEYDVVCARCADGGDDDPRPREASPARAPRKNPNPTIRKPRRTR